MSFLNTFLENARLYPDKIALEFIDAPLQRVTYAELGQLVAQTAMYLHSLGVQAGDRVALQLTKSLEFILLHLATIRLGAVTLPLNLAYPPDEIEYFLSDSGAKVFFTLESAKEKIHSILPRLPELENCIFINPAIPDQFESLITNDQLPNGLDHEITPNVQPYLATVDSQDTAVIIYTSGTTGRPKGAEITHGNLISNLSPHSRSGQPITAHDATDGCSANTRSTSGG